jgi:hypothetical protein
MSGWYKNYLDTIRRHTENHERERRNNVIDLSCLMCYPVKEGTVTREFDNFWQYYVQITGAISFSGKTIGLYNELVENIDDEIEKRDHVNQPMSTNLIWSMRYEKEPSEKFVEIRRTIKEFIIVSNGGQKNQEETYSLLRRNYESSSSEKNSPKEESPKEESLKTEGSSSKKMEYEKEELENSSFLEELRIRVELKRIKKLKGLEKDDVEEKIEEIIISENPYASYTSSRRSSKQVTPGTITPLRESSRKELLEMEKLIRKFTKEKYEKIKEKIGDEIDDRLVKGRRRYNEGIDGRIEAMKERDELTKEKEDEINKERTENEIQVERYIIEETYEELFDERDESEELHIEKEKIELDQNEVKRKWKGKGKELHERSGEEKETNKTTGNTFWNGKIYGRIYRRN